MESVSSSELHFTVDSHLLLELGERLVARRSIALAELAKNAYDADSPDVTITLDKVTKAGGTIVVEDHGEGMTYDMLIKGWMRIATGDKRENPISRKYERVRTGAKGIGRFACRVLSNRLVLESVAVVGSGRKEKVSATFDWKDFKPGSSVGEIGVSCRREPVDYKTDTGTKLTLEDARDVWKETDLNQLRNDLLSLISDYTPEMRVADTEKKRSDPGFQIIIHAPEFPEFQGPIAEQFLKYSWGRLMGRISSEGKPRYDLRVRRLKKDLRYTPDRTFEEVGETYFKVDFFVYRREYFADVPVSLNEARGIGRERGGVRIFFDKFRVFPYGERSEDWLNLDLDRARNITAFREFAEKEDLEDLERPMLFLPGTYQLFGAVFLSREKNRKITMSITRDRLLDNSAFQELTQFVRLGIEWMTVQYARFAPETRGEPPRKENPLKPLEIARGKIVKKEDVLGREATSEILQSLDLARQAFENREEDRISEISMLRVLATTGTMISVFEHELSTMIRALMAENRQLVSHLESLPETHRAKLRGTISRLQNWADSIDETASQLGKMMGRESRDRRRSYPLRVLIDDMIAPFEYHFKTEHVEFVNDLPTGLHLPAMFRCEIYSIFLNLITNAVKAVRESEVRRICIRGASSDDELRLWILDTGRGVPSERREEIFKPFVSDSEPDLLFGEGTGLGLTIVRNTVDTYGGTVNFIDPPENWKTCVEIVLPES